MFILNTLAVSQHEVIITQIKSEYKTPILCNNIGPVQSYTVAIGQCENSTFTHVEKTAEE